MKTLCTTKTIIDRFPIIALARNYKLSYLYDDIVAGISVGLTAIPQSIAYAAIAGIDTKVSMTGSYMKHERVILQQKFLITRLGGTSEGMFLKHVRTAKKYLFIRV